MPSYAADDIETIFAAIQRVRAEATPMCPVDPNRKLYDCLRSVARCGGQCPHVDDWVGPGE